MKNGDRLLRYSGRAPSGRLDVPTPVTFLHMTETGWAVVYDEAEDRCYGVIPGVLYTPEELALVQALEGL